MNVNEMQKVSFDQAAATASESESCLLAAFALLGVPDKMVDLGCGNGHLCRLAAKLNVSAIGADLYVENHSESNLWLETRDLTERWTDPPQADLVLCLEVAEHLPQASADDLVFLIDQVLSDNGILLFSAATPGQGGSGHLNEQPYDYWIDKLKVFGIAWSSEESDALSTVWNFVAPNAWWYGQNIFVLRRTNERRAN